MAGTPFIQPSFAKGEVAPAVYGRVDTAMYAVGLRSARNIFIHPHGGASNRPGTYFTGPVKTHTYAPRLIPFTFKTSDKYMLEFGNLYMRVIRDGGHVLETAKVITGITPASPGVVTSAAHGFSNGDEVYLTGIVGTTELNGNRYVVANVAANTFELTSQVTGANINTGAMTAYASGGTAARVYTLTTPYASADLQEIKYAQSADVITLTHASYPTQDLSRTGHTSWTITPATFKPVQAYPTALVVTKGTVGAAKARYRVTAIGVDESLPGLAASKAITAATRASPGVFTSAAHGFVNGDEVEMGGFVDAGFTVLNGRRFKIANKAANTFELTDAKGVAINSAAYGAAYTASGVVYPTFYEITNLNISAITAANPGVVTVSAGHGVVVGEVVQIEGVVGMTQVNNRSFTVTAITQTTITIENTTGYTAYTSGGSLWKPNTSHNSLAWTAASGGRYYRVYKETNGLYGQVGETEAVTFVENNLFVDYSSGPPRYGEPFLAVGDYPGAVGYFEQRKVLGGSDNAPDTSSYSRIASTGNFTGASPLQPNDAFDATVNAQEVNEIRHFVPLAHLLMLTSGGEWKVSSGPDSGFSIETIRPVPESNWGCSHLRPAIAGKVVIFAEESKKIVRSLGYSLQVDGYTGTQLNLLSAHLLASSALVDWSYTHSPEGRILGVRADGNLVTMTFEPDQEVIAWTVCDTLGDFESVGVLRHDAATTEDTVYVVVKRLIEGQTVRYIEELASRQIDDVQDCFFVDCGLSLDTPISITGATQSALIVITAPAHGLSNGDRVDVSGIEWVGTVDSFGTSTQPAQLNGGSYLVTGAATNTLNLTNLDGSAIDGSAYAAYVSGGYLRKAVSSVGGLWHLEGETVAVLANGNVVEDLVVTGGAVALPTLASRVHVGLAYSSDLETLDIEAQKGTIQGKLKKVSSVTVRFEKSRALFIGPNVSQLVEMKQREFELLGEPTRLLTGDKLITLMPEWNSNGRLFLRQKHPLPMTILAVIPDLVLGG